MLLHKKTINKLIQKLHRIRLLWLRAKIQYYQQLCKMTRFLLMLSNLVEKQQHLEHLFNVHGYPRGKCNSNWIQKEVQLQLFKHLTIGLRNTCRQENYIWCLSDEKTYSITPRSLIHFYLFRFPACFSVDHKIAHY